MLVESAVQTEVIRVEDPLQPAARKRIHEALAGTQGVEDSTVETDRITVSYYPHVNSSGLIQREIEELGCVIDESAQRRGPVHLIRRKNPPLYFNSKIRSCAGHLNVRESLGSPSKSSSKNADPS